VIYKQTKLKIVDNSGAKFIKVFQLLKYSSSQNYSCSGDLVLGSVLKYKANKKINKKQLCQVLIITSKKNILRRNGNFIKFDENRGIIVTGVNKLLGTRIFGPVSKEIKRGTYSRLLSITKKIV
jgi:large subunit ribosomal protein L14